MIIQNFNTRLRIQCTEYTGSAAKKIHWADPTVINSEWR